MSDIDVAGTPSPSGSEISAPAAPAAPAIPSAAPSAPTTGAPQDDRSTWVPPYRLRETREAAVREASQSFAQRESELRREADEYRRQLHALVGVQPPQNPEIDAVRKQFGQLYPGLSKMEEKAAQLEQLLERAGDLESQNAHYWQSYGRQSVDRLFTKTAEALGSPLSDEGKQFLHSSFIGWVQSSPERADRYSNDPSIVDDYVKAFSSNFVDPSRRTTNAGIPGRANIPLPQDTPGGAPRIPAPPQPKDLDERVARGLAMYNSTAKSPIPFQGE